MQGDFDLIQRRLSEQQNHFMTEQMLGSQFADPEEPISPVVVDVAGSPDEIVAEIFGKVGARELLFKPRRSEGSCR